MKECVIVQNRVVSYEFYAIRLNVLVLVVIHDSRHDPAVGLNGESP